MADEQQKPPAKDPADLEAIEGEEQLTEEELSERRLFMEEVFDDLSVIKGKTVKITSTASPGQTRDYYVENLEHIHVPGRRGFISAIRLINTDTPEIYQPTLKYPSEPIKVSTKGNSRMFSLVYSPEQDVLRGFRNMHKKSRPDMKVFIEFTD